MFYLISIYNIITPPSFIIHKFIISFVKIFSTSLKYSMSVEFWCRIFTFILLPKSRAVAQLRRRCGGRQNHKTKIRGWNWFLHLHKVFSSFNLCVYAVLCISNQFNQFHEICVKLHNFEFTRRGARALQHFRRNFNPLQTSLSGAPRVKGPGIFLISSCQPLIIGLLYFYSSFHCISIESAKYLQRSKVWEFFLSHPPFSDCQRDNWKLSCNAIINAKPLFGNCSEYC